MLHRIADKMQHYPSAFSNWGILALCLIYPFYTVAVIGENVFKILAELNAITFRRSPDAARQQRALYQFCKTNLNGIETFIYVCSEKDCKLPVDSVKEALSEITISL